MAQVSGNEYATQVIIHVNAIRDLFISLRDEDKMLVAHITLGRDNPEIAREMKVPGGLLGVKVAALFNRLQVPRNAAPVIRRMLVQAAGLAASGQDTEAKDLVGRIERLWGGKSKRQGSEPDDDEAPLQAASSAAKICAVDRSVSDAMLRAQPSLRAFAVSLCGNLDRADDLVQETLLRAWANLNSFEPGTNMPAWLFTILRNLFRSEYRKRRREVPDSEGTYADTLKTQPDQSSRVEFEEFRVALGKLPSDQREALVLVGASGYTYEEASRICGCAVGTIKSRVNRARTRLAELMSIESLDDFGPDRELKAVLHRSYPD